MVFFLCGGWGARLRWSLLGADRGGLLALRDLEPGCKSLLARKKTMDFIHGLFLCGGWDLNPHVIAYTRSLVLLVCQFRHLRRRGFFNASDILTPDRNGVNQILETISESLGRKSDLTLF